DRVRPRAADARDQALVAEERVEPARLVGEDLLEPLGAEPERLRAEVRELRLRRVGREQPHACALLRAGLRQDEPSAALEDELERRRLRAFLPEAQVAEA